mmetsp:Transcript_103421/g.170227  ORF Transcript_103421/g.170227 Transcript_103421/m.170227 type:complete len:101 (+) Transcript_103421:860-1162(+)
MRRVKFCLMQKLMGASNSLSTARDVEAISMPALKDLRKDVAGPHLGLQMMLARKVLIARRCYGTLRQNLGLASCVLPRRTAVLVSRTVWARRSSLPNSQA